MTAVTLGGLTAFNGLDIPVLQVAAHTGTSTFATAAAATGPTSAPATSTAAALTAPTTSPTTTSPAPATVGAVAPTAITSANTSVAGQILRLVNAQRLKAGCRAVTLDSRLTAAAAGHASDMAVRNYFSHTSKSGATFVDRIEAQGYSAPKSENIAAGQASVTAVMNAWIKSSGHRANILDCSATQMGAASAKGGNYGIYWVQDFGRG
ncbi:MAG: CAP domain-containing protein [Pseudonocardiales bacterium]|nr:CAP domain-containing protein [Pseudonocardiales bacterium]